MFEATDAKQVISFEQLPLYLMIQQDVLIRLLVEKGIFSKEEFLEIVTIVNQGMKKTK